jgi:glycosyltransferase involved in cell wall biosynthesis
VLVPRLHWQPRAWLQRSGAPTVGVMRILHSGNVANNAYNNAKLLRRAGVAADALCDERHIFSQPEWEDAPLAGTFAQDAALEEVAAAAGWHRPDWILSPRAALTNPQGRAWLDERIRLALSTPRLNLVYRRLLREFAPLRDVLGTELGLFDVLRASVWMSRLSREVVPLGPLFRSYDLVQANGLHPILTLLAAPDHPVVAFEHGTLRDLPFQDSWAGRLLSLAYRSARAIVITNPDVIGSARQLGLDNYFFVPHPIDETKYTPGHSELRDRIGLRASDFVLFSPASHNWGIKGSDIMLRAFAELVRQGPAESVLVLTEWGLELDRSRALIDELGIGGRIRWVKPLPKLQLIEAYRSADIVLDQFLIGTFGGIAPEAMACGRPVIMAYDAEVNAWAFPTPPPIVPARTVEELSRQLVRLGREPDERTRIGRAGRDWVERHHGWQLVADRQLKIYEEVLEGTPARASS